MDTFPFFSLADAVRCGGVGDGQRDWDVIRNGTGLTHSYDG